MGVGQLGSTKFMILHLSFQVSGSWGISQKTSTVLLRKLHNKTFDSIAKYKISPSLGWKASTKKRGYFCCTSSVSHGEFFWDQLVDRNFVFQVPFAPAFIIIVLQLPNTWNATETSIEHWNLTYSLAPSTHSKTISFFVWLPSYRLLKGTTTSSVVRINPEKTATITAPKKQAFIRNSTKCEVSQFKSLLTQHLWLAPFPGVGWDYVYPELPLLVMKIRNEHHAVTELLLVVVMAAN